MESYYKPEDLAKFEDIGKARYRAELSGLAGTVKLTKRWRDRGSWVTITPLAVAGR